jgi:methyl-accepting chemotaxis protein
MLNNLSQKLDNATIEVFKCLDQIKKDNIVENKQQVEKVDKEKSVASIQPSVKTFENSVQKNTNVTANNKKSTVITSSAKDDDEWESF